MADPFSQKVRRIGKLLLSSATLLRLLSVGRTYKNNFVLLFWWCEEMGDERWRFRLEFKGQLWKKSGGGVCEFG